jgi:hypothetical protein
MIRITFRMPEDLWVAIKAIAKQEQRSLNAQIVYILWQFVKNQK